MRPLNRNERLLAIALGFIVLLLLNFAGMRWVADTMRSSRNRIAQLESENTALQRVLAERPYWVARQKWLDANPPAAYSERTSRTEFVQSVQAAVSAQGLKIVSQQPLDTERVGPLAVTNIDLVLSGRFQSLIRWLHAIQQPGKYALIRSFTLKQGEDGNSMQLQVRLGRIYRVAATSP